MAQQKGLGRGLGALLSDYVPAAEPENGFQQLPLQKVEPNPNQPRRDFPPEELDALAESIRVHGILQPLTVRQLPNGYYQIIAGERRWRAARLAGLVEVPALVIEADDRTAMELALIENLQRQDLNPVEEAQGFHRLITEYGMTQEEAAQRVGKSRPAVANALRLLALPDPVCLLVEEGQLSAGHARAILAVPSGEAQMKLAKKVVADGLSVRQTEALAKRLAQGGQAAAAARSDELAIYDRAAEKDLGARLGRKVHIVRGRRKGKIELEYYDPDDLNALLDLLGQMPGRGKGAQGR